MNSLEILKKGLSKDNLNEIYYHKVRPKAVAGLDKTDKYRFDEQKDDEYEIIERKILNGTYKFTRYKKILISKGEGKNPRVINLPTIRDKLVLAVLNDGLNKIYNNENCSKLPHLIIDDIKKTIYSKEYNYFIKYDITSFYASIKHDVLMRKIRYKVRNMFFLNVIYKAIKNDGIVFPIKKTYGRKNREEGIPEGLSISNSLANIYLMSLDKKMNSIPNVKYYRYVDDIIIMCNYDDKDEIDSILKKEICQKLKLKLNQKCTEGYIEKNNFEYLGYNFSKDSVSVRESSKYKLENSVETLLAKYKCLDNKNEELLKWKLNLKISGCIYQGKKYGWMFFFSQIDDMKILSKLDWLVLKLLDRYKINIIPKKFKKTYYEIKNNLHNTKYIINFDRFSLEQKKETLDKIYKKTIKGFTEKQINDLFENVIFKDISLLEEDIQHFS